MKLVNDKAILSTNSFVRESYQMNVFLQVVLTTINGVTLKATRKDTDKLDGALLSENSEIMIRNEIPIANIYFKFCHMDLSLKQKHFEDENMGFLTNKYQEIVIDDLLIKIEK